MFFKFNLICEVGRDIRIVEEFECLGQDVSFERFIGVMMIGEIGDVGSNYSLLIRELFECLGQRIQERDGI